MAQKLFVSYSHRDRPLLDQLRVRLKPLERKGLISPWFDGYLVPGDDFDRKIKAALEEAELVALLVTPDFIHSDYCYDIEMQRAVERHQSGQARVIPIIARACQWQETPFGNLLATPTDAQPIMSRVWPDKDEAWNIVASDIAAAAKAGARVVVPSGIVEGAVALTAVQRADRPFELRVPKVVTDRDKDDALRQAMDYVATRFSDAINRLEPPLEGRFHPLDQNRFTATIYRDGARVAGCTVWIGGPFGRNSIAFNSNDDGRTDAMNDSLALEHEDGELFFVPMMTMSGRGKGRLKAPQVAEYFWANLIERVRR